MYRIYLYLILAASVSALATDMIVPALPLLQKAFNTDYSSIQLTISGFLVIYAASQLLSGFLGEKLNYEYLRPAFCSSWREVSSVLCPTA